MNMQLLDNNKDSINYGYTLNLSRIDIYRIDINVLGAQKREKFWKAGRDRLWMCHIKLGSFTAY